MTAKAGAPYRLRDWLGIFHPAYRGYLAAMVCIGLLGGVLTYFNLEFLQGLVKTYGALDQFGSTNCSAAREIHFLTGVIVCNGLATGWGVVLLVLLAYVLLELLIAVNSTLRLYAQGYLDIKSRGDIEREILLNLLRKDDQFFQRNSVTQITNRLSEDTERMFERREDMSAIWAVTVEAVGALYFLWTQHWSYSAAVLVFTLCGVLIIHRMLAAIKQLDGEQLQGDDNVKAAFEDYLQAAPEAQMGNLSDRIVKGLQRAQARRRQANIGLLRLNGRLSATYDITELIAFAAIMSAIVYVVSIHGLALEDGLVAAVVRAVPQTYGNISQLATLFMKLQLADVSAKRLMEYEAADLGVTNNVAASALDAGTAPPRAPADIRLESVKYAFAPGGPLQGGENGMTLSLPPRSLNVVVGPSGSGKSMLSQLLLGRLKPVSGRVTIGGKAISTMSQDERAALIGYMPQSLAVISGSIAENIEFGLAETIAADEPDERTAGGGLLRRPDALQWIEATGVGQIARGKALDLYPSAGDAVMPVDVGTVDLGALRHRLRTEVEAETGLALNVFGQGAPVPHFMVVEQLTRASCDLGSFVERAFRPDGYEACEAMTRLPGADAIIDFGTHIVSRTRHMLTRCQSIDAYNELAPHALHEAVWDLRRELARHETYDHYDINIQGELMLAGLTARPMEAAIGQIAALAPSLANGPEQPLGRYCRDVYAPVLEQLDETRFNVFLNWRDNLLFASATANSPAARATDQALLKTIAGTPQDDWLLAGGLDYDVGRHGRRLSGGQRQLLCLCRSLVQASPILVLDEPTAALDPRKRGEINGLLRELAGERTIIVITHDPDLARLADQVVMVMDGRIAAVGRFSDLQRDDGEFRAMAGLTLATAT